MTKEYRYSHAAVMFNTFFPKTFYINKAGFQKAARKIALKTIQTNSESHKPEKVRR